MTFSLAGKNSFAFHSLVPPVDLGAGPRPIKRAKVRSSDEVGSLNKAKQVECSNSHVFFSPPSHPLPSTTTVAVPLSCFINPDLQQQQASHSGLSTSSSSSFTVDLNTFKTNGMNIIFAPPSSVTSSNSSQSSPPSEIPLVLTFGNLPYPPT